MKKLMITICMLLAFVQTTFAQETLQGKITDSNGGPLPGVTILVQGATNGTTSDFDGLYSLQNITSNDIILYSYIGFETQEIKVGTNKTINIQMAESSVGLEEVIVVGYGTVKRKDLTGSVASVKVEELTKTATVNFDQALAGRVTGVNVSSTDGTPGQALNITIRGGNSITGDNTPLYVIDGIPLEDFDPASISTNDIEGFDILKDASATAIYGSRGANGVILITTKEGRSDGKTDVKFSSSYGVSWVPTRLEVLSPYAYVKQQENIALAQDQYQAGGNQIRFFKGTWIDPELYRDAEGTNWQDEIFRLASTSKYNLSLSGGNKDTKLYFSSEYLDQEGTLINTGFKKILNNLKFNHRISKKTSLAGYLQYTHIKRNGVQISGDSYTSIIRDAIQFRPVEPINDDGRGEGGFDPTDDDFKYLFNPVKNLNNTDRKLTQDVIRGSLNLNHKITRNLFLKLSGSYQVDNRKESIFYGEDTQQGTNGTDGINGLVRNRNYTTLSTSNTLTYKKRIDNHSLSFLGGMEAQARTYNYSYLKNSQIPTDILGINKLVLGTSPSLPETLASANKLLSFFARANYDYKKKFLFTATMRADGSSKFKPENRWGYFPSFSGAWKLSSEDFIKDIDAISFAKLRAGWGETGNNRIGDYDAYNQLDFSLTSGYVSGEGQAYTPGAYQSNLGVPDLRWETTTQTNIGLDLGFLNQRLETTIDYYIKNTRDLLLDAEMALNTGFTSVQQNVGKVQNKGLELSITSKNFKTAKFKWNTTFNISFNKNKAISLNSGQDAILTNPDWNFKYNEYQYITKVGEPVGMIYGLEYDRIYQYSDFNWDNALQQYILKDGIPDNGGNVQPGSVKFIDQNNDGTITSSDRVIIGNPQPKHFGGLTNSFEVGNFDLQVMLQWSYGRDVLNANKAVFGVPTTGIQNGFSSVLDAWSPQNTDTDTATIRYESVYGAAPPGNQIDSRHVEDGSYLRLSTLALGYSIPTPIVEKIHLNRVRVYVTAQNLFTWTNYSGYNPDVSVANRTYGALAPNLDYSAYPQSATVMTGIDITF